MRTSQRHRLSVVLALGLALAAATAAPVVAQTNGGNTPGVASPPPDLSSKPADGVAAIAGNAQLDDSFVFTPTVPCRVLDTRLATGGILANNSTRSFDVYGGSVGAPQGGLNCGLTSRTRAVHINVTAVSVTGGAAPGFLTVFPFSAPQPNTSVMNFTAGQTVANAFTVVTCISCSDELSIFNAFGTTHVIVDIMGVYEQPYVAEVNADGTVNSATAGMSASKLSAGRYQVNFPRDVTDCAVIATVADHGGGGNPQARFIGTADRSAVPTAKYVETDNASDTQTDSAFSIVGFC